VVSGFHSGSQPVTSEVPRGLTLGLMLFNIFLSDLDDGIESTITTFVHDTTLGGEGDASEGKAILQADLGRLKEQASKKSMEFNRAKCKILHQGRHSQTAQCRPGSAWLESSLAESDPGVLADTELNTSQQRATASTKADQILGGIRRDVTREIRDVIIPRYQALGRPRLEYCVQFWSPQFKKRHRQTREGPKESGEDDQSLQNLPYEEKLNELGPFSLEKRRLRGTSQFSST